MRCPSLLLIKKAETWKATMTSSGLLVRRGHGGRWPLTPMIFKAMIRGSSSKGSYHVEPSSIEAVSIMAVHFRRGGQSRGPFEDAVVGGRGGHGGGCVSIVSVTKSLNTQRLRLRV